MPAAGMDAHVSKPFTRTGLPAAVEKAVTAPNAPPGAASPEAEPVCPEFDRAMFEDNTGLLSASKVQEHIQILITRCEALMRGLRSVDMPTHAGELVEDAHRLAGSAGTFGFLRLADMARRFERAAEQGVPDTAALGAHLAAAAEVAAAMMRRDFAGVAAVAT